MHNRLLCGDDEPSREPVTKLAGIIAHLFVGHWIRTNRNRSDALALAPFGRGSGGRCSQAFGLTPRAFITRRSRARTAFRKLCEWLQTEFSVEVELTERELLSALRQHLNRRLADSSLDAQLRAVFAQALALHTDLDRRER